LRGCTKNIAVRENIFGAKKSGEIARKYFFTRDRAKILSPVEHGKFAEIICRRAE